MKLFINLFLVTLVLAFSIAAQTPNAAKTEPALRVEVDGGKTLDLTAKDLAKFTRRDVKAKAHDEKESIYSGYNLSDILLAAGARIGKDELKGKELGAYLLVEAADGYKAIFAIAEIAPEFTDKVILLADTRDGKPLDSKTGTWQIIVPDDKKHGRWVRRVTALKIRLIDNKSSSVVMDNFSEEDAIREIIFRKILEPWFSSNDSGLKNYYLAVDGNKDPREKLLKKLTAEFKVPLKKSSESIISAEDGDVVLDVISKQRGVLFSISKLEWKSQTEIKASAGIYIGNMGANGCDFTLKKQDGEWKIISSEKCYVS